MLRKIFSPIDTQNQWSWSGQNNQQKQQQPDAQQLAAAAAETEEREKDGPSTGRRGGDQRHNVMHAHFKRKCDGSRQTRSYQRKDHFDRTGVIARSKSCGANDHQVGRKDKQHRNDRQWRDNHTFWELYLYSASSQYDLPSFLQLMAIFGRGE